jgi:hypothetical protein
MPKVIWAELTDCVSLKQSPQSIIFNFDEPEFIARSELHAFALKGVNYKRRCLLQMIVERWRNPFFPRTVLPTCATRPLGS